MMKTIEVKNLSRCPCCYKKAAMLHSPLRGFKVRCTRCGMSTVFLATKSSAKRCWGRRIDRADNMAKALYAWYVDGQDVQAIHDMLRSLAEFGYKV